MPEGEVTAVQKRMGLRLSALALACGLLVGCVPAASGKTPDPSPAPTPQQLPAEASGTDTAELLKHMTLREKVGQLFLVRSDALDPALSQQTIDDADAPGVTEVSDAMAAFLERYPVGGVVLFGKNITDETQLRGLIAGLQQSSPVPMLIGIDEEGGAVARLANSHGFDLPRYESAAAVGAEGADAVKEMSAQIGAYLAEYGVSLDFAPVADVNTNPENPVIGTRAFSSQPQEAADCVAAAVEGFSRTGVLCCLKHFPGHGDTAQDSHDGAVYTDKTMDELRSCEFLPFAAGIQAGAPLVMVGHIAAPNAVEGEDGQMPATFSRTIITDVLRGELGFTGAVVTDSLSMGAVTETYTPGEAAVLALQAGADLLLMPAGLAQAYDEVLAAVEDGRLTEARIEESVTRILALKQQAGLLAAPGTLQEDEG